MDAEQNTQKKAIIVFFICLLLVILIIIAIIICRNSLHKVPDKNHAVKRMERDMSETNMKIKELQQLFANINELNEKTKFTENKNCTISLITSFLTTLHENFSTNPEGAKFLDDLRNSYKDKHASKLTSEYIHYVLKMIKDNETMLTRVLPTMFDGLRMQNRSENFKHFNILCEQFSKVLKEVQFKKADYEAMKVMKEFCVKADKINYYIILHLQKINFLLKNFYELLNKYSFYELYGDMINKNYANDDDKELVLRVFASMFKTFLIVAEQVRCYLSYCCKKTKIDYIDGNEHKLKDLYEECKKFTAALDKHTHTITEKSTKLVTYQNFITFYRQSAFFLQISFYFQKKYNTKKLEPNLELEMKDIDSSKKKSDKDYDPNDVDIIKIFDKGGIILLNTITLLYSIMNSTAICDGDLIKSIFKCLDENTKLFNEIEGDFAYFVKIFEYFFLIDRPKEERQKRK